MASKACQQVFEVIAAVDRRLHAQAVREGDVLLEAWRSTVLGRREGAYLPVVFKCDCNSRHAAARALDPTQRGARHSNFIRAKNFFCVKFVKNI